MFLASICLGVWLSYSLATISVTDDTFSITSTKNWKTAAYFSVQLILFLSGVFLILWFIFFRLDLSFSERISNYVIPADCEMRAILRKPLLIGLSKNEMISRWGEPDKTKQSGTESTIHYIYPSLHSSYTVTVEDGIIVSILEEYKPVFRGR